jgi:hypothetical protein
MAFVLNNEVVFTFQVDLKKFNNIIEVKGDYKSREMISFYDQLSSAVKAKVN